MQLYITLNFNGLHRSYGFVHVARDMYYSVTKYVLRKMIISILYKINVVTKDYSCVDTKKFYSENILLILKLYVRN